MGSICLPYILNYSLSSLPRLRNPARSGIMKKNAEGGKNMPKTIVFHETDLFRPHNDPDDHYDLACQFALAKRGLTDLAGVLLDYPPDPSYGDPDVAAAAELGVITGLAVPVGIGQKRRGLPPGSGLLLLKRVLEAAESPVSLFIVGSCRDVFEAGTLWPSLFRDKVGAIYLNAGAAVDTPRLEYNVWLDPASFAGIFSLPCPVFWMPCFHSMAEEDTVGRHGSFWKFQQKMIFDRLPDRVLNYFLDVLSKRQGADWLAPLDAPVDPRLRAFFGESWRNMWCTAGFLYAAGLTVLRDGGIARRGERPAEEVFSFRPVAVDCREDGRAAWRETAASDRMLFTVEDPASYQEAMTRALLSLLLSLDGGEGFLPSPGEAF